MSNFTLETFEDLDQFKYTWNFGLFTISYHSLKAGNFGFDKLILQDHNRNHLDAGVFP